MAGLLTHLGAGFAGALAIYLGFFKSKPKSKIIYGLIFVFANIAPDLINFGVLGTINFTLDTYGIMKMPYFRALSLLGHTYWHWMVFALAVMALAFLLFKIRKISKKSIKAVGISMVLLLIGVYMHLWFDKLIQEMNHWI